MQGFSSNHYTYGVKGVKDYPYLYDDPGLDGVLVDEFVNNVFITTIGAAATYNPVCADIALTGIYAVKSPSCSSPWATLFPQYHGVIHACCFLQGLLVFSLILQS